MYFFFILEWRYHSKAKLSGTTVTTMYLVSNVFFILPFLLSILFRCHGFSAELFICDCEFVLFVQLVKYCKYKEPNLSQNKIHVLERLVVLFYLVDIHTVTGFTTACRGLSPNFCLEMALKIQIIQEHLCQGLLLNFTGFIGFWSTFFLALLTTQAGF